MNEITALYWMSNGLFGNKYLSQGCNFYVAIMMIVDEQFIIQAFKFTLADCYYIH